MAELTAHMKAYSAMPRRWTTGGPGTRPGCSSTRTGRRDVRPLPAWWLRRARQHLGGEPE
ncbi:hypothetical protein [Streptomyces sp. 8N616]|uniref:hypothetical protein n=1 Tax=Streptomyces sp. 8N616 TaxID=3457414 RepID=UPI003FD63C49